MAMTDQTDKGYYHCKIKHEQLYNEFIAAHRKNATLDQLCMLQHDTSTQPNESMKNSVAAIAPKNKNKIEVIFSIGKSTVMCRRSDYWTSRVVEEISFGI